MATRKHNNQFFTSGGFNVNGSQPIDSRIIVDTYNDLLDRGSWVLADGTNVAYTGMVVTAKDTGDVYVLKNPQATTNKDSWKKIGADGSGTITVNTIDLALNDAKAKKAAGISPVGQIYFVKVDRDSNKHKGEAGTYIVSNDSTLDGDIDTAIKASFTKFGAATSADELISRVQNLERSVIKTITIGGVEHKVTSEDGKGVATAHTFDTDVTGTTNSLNAPTTRAVEEAYKKLNDLISPIPRFEIVVASKLPEPATKEHLAKVYLIPSGPVSKETEDMYTEYVCVEKKSEQTTYSWEKLGAASVDLVNYVSNETFNAWKGSDFNPVKNNATNGKAAFDALGGAEGYATGTAAKDALDKIASIESRLGNAESAAANGKAAFDALGGAGEGGYATGTAAKDALDQAKQDHATLGTATSDIEKLQQTVADYGTVKNNASAGNTAATSLGKWATSGAEAEINKIAGKADAEALNDLSTKAETVKDVTAKAAAVHAESTVTAANDNARGRIVGLTVTKGDNKTSEVTVVIPKVVSATPQNPEGEDSMGIDGYYKAYTNEGELGLMTGREKRKLDDIRALTNKEIDDIVDPKQV